MNQNKVNLSKIKEVIKYFNKSEMRKALVPLELASGWPSIRMINKRLCITIPYFRKAPAENCYALYPIWCSVTIMYKNPNKILDFTIYSTSPEWSDVDFSKPVGKFKHKELDDVKTRDEYIALCDKLYDRYDEMIAAVLANKPFEGEEKMRELFAKLMEPSLYPYYEKINKKFYFNFYQK